MVRASDWYSEGVGFEFPGTFSMDIFLTLSAKNINSHKKCIFHLTQCILCTNSGITVSLVYLNTYTVVLQLKMTCKRMLFFHSNVMMFSKLELSPICVTHSGVL